jgi:hypothetical protein
VVVCGAVWCDVVLAAVVADVVAGVAAGCWVDREEMEGGIGESEGRCR